MTTTIPIKLISPGMGSSGYYPPATLKAAAADKVFKRGTQMFWVDNTTHGSGVEDPERLAAVLETDAEWLDNGRDGAGLYATAAVFSDYETKVLEKGRHIGLSIVGSGDVTEGDLPSGKRGRVINRITAGQSVDFVTKAGRDGKVLFESATTPEGEEVISEAVTLINEVIMTDQIKETAAADARVAILEAKVATLEAENKRLTASAILHEAERTAASAWQDEKYAPIPASIRTLFERAAVANMPLKEGKLDTVALLTSVQESADAYIAALPAPTQSAQTVTDNGGGAVDQLTTMREASVKRIMERYPNLTEAQARAIQ
jgi:hypothetical protein